MPTPYSQTVPGADELDDDIDFYNGNVYRTLACKVLERSNVPFVVWFGDVASFYRHGHLNIRKTMTIVVHDLDAAESVLKRYGWQIKPLDPERNEHNEVLALNMKDPKHVQRRLYFPSWTAEGATAFSRLIGLGDLDDATAQASATADYSDTITLVLLLDSEWHFDVEQHWKNHSGGANARSRDRQQQQHIIIPPLDKYVDALITRRIELYDPDDDDNIDYRVPADGMTQLYYFDEWSRTLPALRDPQFVNKLRPENRQYHLDSLAGKTWGVEGRGYERKMWEARQGLSRTDKGGSVTTENADRGD